jgi:hypothetical protein
MSFNGNQIIATSGGGALPRDRPPPASLPSPATRRTLRAHGVGATTLSNILAAWVELSYASCLR